MTSIQLRAMKNLLVSALLTSVPLQVGNFFLAQASQAEAVNPVAEAVELNTNPPEELQMWVKQMDEMGESKRLKPFMRNFDSDFAHEDGLNKRQFKQTIKSFWKKFDQLSYSTSIDSWSQVAPGVYSTITTTTIEGQQVDAITPQKLMSTIRSEQRIEQGKIVSQAVLEEKSQITSGAKPPTVRINLPQTVKVGEDYYFDVIVDEPLGDRILLGAAIEETVNPETYLSPSKFDIQSLATGGLFKIGQAPDQPTDQWISALLIQDGGMYLMSQRISVVNSVETATAK